MFILLFAYVFGSAISVPGIGYREFLIPGIFAQTVSFGATITAAGLADDMKKGVIDRFRSLPMSRSAVLVGRTSSDVGNNVLVIVIMSVTGLLVGWRIRSSVDEALAGFLLLLLFAYAISWIMAWIGLLVPSPEVVNNASFMVIFPLTFIANTFVPTNNFPGPLKAVANWNPVSSVTQAARDLFGNTNPTAAVPDYWSLQHPVLYTLGWVALLLVVCSFRCRCCSTGRLPAADPPRRGSITASNKNSPNRPNVRAFAEPTGRLPAASAGADRA